MGQAAGPKPVSGATSHSSLPLRSPADPIHPAAQLLLQIEEKGRQPVRSVEAQDRLDVPNPVQMLVQPTSTEAVRSPAEPSTLTRIAIDHALVTKRPSM